MIAKEYCIAFCEGYFYAQLGEKLTNGKVTEHTLDLAKETAQTCMEQQIAYSSFDEKQKQEMKESKRPKTDLVIWERRCNFVASNFKRK